MPLARSTQATPDAQHEAPHGVDPFGQQQPPLGSEHVSPALQQKFPHLGAPDGQPHVPVEALRHTVLRGQHVDPQPCPDGQHAPPAHVSVVLPQHTALALPGLQHTVLQLVAP